MRSRCKVWGLETMQSVEAGSLNKPMEKSAKSKWQVKFEGWSNNEVQVVGRIKHIRTLNAAVLHAAGTQLSLLIAKIKCKSLLLLLPILLLLLLLLVFLLN